MAKSKYCVVCGELIAGRGKKFCSKDEELQMMGLWDYNENDPYREENEENYQYDNGSRNEYGQILWRDMRAWKER